MTDRISSIAPYYIPAAAEPHPWWSHKPYILVRVETVDGIVGWGECHHLNFREEALLATLRSVASTLVGRPAGDIRSFLHEAYNSFGQQRPGLEVYAAFAGIEIALWDVLGKRLNTPVYQLLGGSHRDAVPVYANIYTPHPQPADRFAEMAACQAAAGHRTIKLYPFVSETSVSDGVAVLAAVREAVGPEVGLAVDLWRQADPHRAIELAIAMEPFDLLWIEDPFAPTDTASMRYVRDNIRQPLLTGETLPTRREFAGLFGARAVDIVNPDICLSGLIELHAIASMAETSYITVSPHNSNSMALGTAAAVHAALGISNLEPVEYFPLFEAALDHLCEGRPPVVNGSIQRPASSGLGIAFDEHQMQKYRA